MRWLVVLGLLELANVAEGGSFRGGTVAWWIPDPVGSPRTIELEVTTTWDNPTTDATSVTFDYGDGSATATLDGPVLYTDTTVVLGQGYALHRFTVTHTYTTDGPFTVAITGCCRHATANNQSATTPFRVQAGVHFGADRGSPSMLAVDPMFPVNYSGSAYIGVALYGAAPLARLSFASESGLSVPTVTNPQTNATETPSAGYAGSDGLAVTWNLAGVARGVAYELSVVVQSPTDAAISSTIDFIAETQNAQSQGTCSFPWAIYGAAAGEPIVATSSPSASMAVVAPVGATLSTTSTAATFTWTTTPAELGRHELGLLHVLTSSSSLSRPCAFELDVLGAYAHDCYASPTICDPNAACIDAASGFQCVCGPHYGGDGLTCSLLCWTDYDPRDACPSYLPHSVYPTCCYDSNGNTSCTCPPDQPPNLPDAGAPLSDAGGGAASHSHGCQTGEPPSFLIALLLGARWLRRRHVR